MFDKLSIFIIQTKPVLLIDLILADSLNSIKVKAFDKIAEKILSYLIIKDSSCDEIK